VTGSAADPGLGGESPGPKPGGLTAPGPQLVRVRATVHLPGGPGEPTLAPGDIVDVTPSSPFIQDCLRAQTLVPLPAHLQPAGERPNKDVK